VAGNQSVEKVTDNALRVLAAAGLQNIPVVAGQQKPLLRPPVGSHEISFPTLNKINRRSLAFNLSFLQLHCPEIHGKSGLDGPLGGPVLLPTTMTAVPGKAAILMFEAIRHSFSKNKEEPVTLIATGALSNVALLLMLYPELVDQRMVEIVLMGGAIGIGNTHPVAEFNIQTDPEAAHVVFTSGAPVCMVPLEVTHTALVTKQVMQKILTPPDHPFLKLIAELLLFFADTYKKVFKFEDGPPLHDPVAVAYAIAPEIFVVEKLHVEVERCSPLSSGQTIVDVWGRSGLQPNATVCKSVDVDAFWELLINAVRDAAAVVSTPLTPPNPLA